MAKLTRDEINQALRQIVIDQTNVDPDRIHENAVFLDDLDCDSLDVVELMMAIEDKFQDELDPHGIPEVHAERLRTYGDALNYIESGGTKLPA